MATDERIREAVESFIGRLRQDLEAHAPALTSHLVQMHDERQEHWRAEKEHAVASTRTELERSLQEQLDAAREEIARHFDARLAAESAEIQGSASMKQNVQSARADGLDRLLASVRRIDEATSLTGILDGLTRAVAASASRVAVLFIDGTMLRRWSDSGFADEDRPFDMPLGETGVMAAAIAVKQTSFVPPVTAGHESATPGFMRVTPGHTGLVVPILVGGDVVAVVYADDVGNAEEHEDAPVWTEEVDLLVRHGAMRLENVTSVRTVEVLTR